MPIVVLNIITDNLIDPVLVGGRTINQQPHGEQTTLNTTDVSPNPEPNSGQNVMLVVVPNIITDNLINPVLLRAGAINQQWPGA